MGEWSENKKWTKLNSNNSKTVVWSFLSKWRLNSLIIISLACLKIRSQPFLKLPYFTNFNVSNIRLQFVSRTGVALVKTHWLWTDYPWSLFLFRSQAITTPIISRQFKEDMLTLVAVWKYSIAYSSEINKTSVFKYVACLEWNPQNNHTA